MKRKSFPWELPPEIEERLGENSYGPQRAIFEVGHLLLILHQPPGEEDLKRDVVLFWRKPNGEHWCNGRDGGEVRLRQLMQSYRTAWEECETAYEEARTAKDLFGVLERLVPLNRASTNLANALQKAREHVKKDRFLIAMRDEGHEVSRAFELLAADAKLALDYRAAKNAELHAARAEEMAVSQHKLNTLAAFTFPLMALATLFGMNLPSGLEEEPSLVFWAVVASAFLVGFLVKGWVAGGRSGSDESS